MKAIAIDDEPMALEIIKAHAAKIPFLELVGTFSQAGVAMEFMQRQSVDLLILDIKMPDISGLEFYNCLHIKPLVIFSTAYAEHAVSGFELDAIDYLLKPYSLSRFMKACNKALELHLFRQGVGSKDEQHIVLKSGNDQYKIAYNDILWAEATGNYVTFTLTDRKLLVRSTFGEVIHWLPPNQFFRIHRSFLVNLKKVERADKVQVFIAGNSLPLSEGYYKLFLESWR